MWFASKNDYIGVNHSNEISFSNYPHFLTIETETCQASKWRSYQYIVYANRFDSRMFESAFDRLRLSKQCILLSLSSRTLHELHLILELYSLSKGFVEIKKWLYYFQQKSTKLTSEWVRWMFSIRVSRNWNNVFTSHCLKVWKFANWTTFFEESCHYSFLKSAELTKKWERYMFLNRISPKDVVIRWFAMMCANSD